jgi:hypothetical protein
VATAIGGFNALGSGGFVGNIADLVAGLFSQTTASALARQPQTAHAGQRQVLSVRRRSRRSPVQAP